VTAEFKRTAKILCLYAVMICVIVCLGPHFLMPHVDDHYESVGMMLEMIMYNDLINEELDKHLQNVAEN